jgi:hypothetical protein
LVARRRGNKANARVNERIELAYELEANVWNGSVKLQMNVKDMSVA